MRKLFILSMCVLLSCAAHAAGKNPVALHGFDKMSCVDWASSLGIPPVRQLYVVWIRGIVTGYNFANPDRQVALDQMPDDVMLEIYVDGYCREHPSLAIAGAAFALIGDRRAKPMPQEGAARSNAHDEAAFQHWLKLQSKDMQTLDVDVLRNIYNKESALGPK